jgi:hypothetical protein
MLNALRLDVFVLNLPFGQHALMKEARHKNPFGFLTVEEDVPPMLHPPETGADIVALAT